MVNLGNLIVNDNPMFGRNGRLCGAVIIRTRIYSGREKRSSGDKSPRSQQSGNCLARCQGGALQWRQGGLKLTPPRRVPTMKCPRLLLAGMALVLTSRLL